MLRPAAKLKTLKGVMTVPVTAEQKDEARARILARLIAHGSISGTWDEIQEGLGLTDIGRALFRRSCWHLKVGDRDPEGRARITVRRDYESDRLRMYDRPPFKIKAIV